MGRPGTGPSSYLPQQQPQNQSEYDLQPQEYQYEGTHETVATGDHEAALTYDPNYYVEENQPDQRCQPEQPNNPQAQHVQQPQQQQQPTQFPPPQTNPQAYGAQPTRPILMQQNNVQTYQNGQNQPGAYPPPAQPVNFPPGSPQNNQMYQNGIPAKPEQQFPPQSPRKSPVFQNGQNRSPVYQQQGPVQFPPTGQNFQGYQTPQGQGVQFQQPQQYVAAGSVPGIPLQPQPQPTPRIQNGWTSGLFDCMNDPMNALITLLFPCLTFGQIAEIIDEGQTSCGTSGMLYGAIAFCIAVPCIMSCTYRTKLRSKFGLPEAPAPDWITHFLCEYCAICQEYRELQARGWDPSIGWQGNLARNQNMNQQQVAMMPPMNQRMMG